MKDTAIRLSKTFFITLFCILLIGSLPAMFHGVKLAPDSYMKSLIHVIHDILQPSHLVYINHINLQVVTRPLFPFYRQPMAVLSVSVIYFAYLSSHHQPFINLYDTAASGATAQLGKSLLFSFGIASGHSDTRHSAINRHLDI